MPQSRVPIALLELLDGKDVLVGVIDVATDEVETPDEVAAVIGEAMKYVAQGKDHRLHQLRHGADAPMACSTQCADVVLEDLLLGAAQSRPHRRDLGDDVDAVAVVLDHAGEPAHLALDAA